MSTQPQTERHLALLIDGDNISHKKSEQIVNKVSNDWTVAFCHVYGNSNNLPHWEKAMQQNTVKIQTQYYPAKGKNAADIALIIGATKILLSKTVQGFCIVSSDSDFTQLCKEIHEERLFVMGIGEKKTPKPFVNACDVCLFVEDIISPKQNAQPQIPPPPNPTTKNPKDAIDLLRNAFDKCAKEDGWVHLGALGQALYRLDTNFDSGTYGCNQLSKLIQSLPHQFIIREDKTAVRIKTQP